MIKKWVNKMPEGIMGAVDRIYENFLIRDLTYFFGGCLLLASFYYAYGGNLINAIDYISQNFLKFIIFVSVSYFIGLIGYSGVMNIQNLSVDKKILKNTKIFKTLPNVPEPYKDNELLLLDIEKQYGLGIIRKIERINYLKRLGAVTGSSSIISSLILLVPLIKYHRINDFIIFFVLIFITIFCIMHNRRWYKRHNEILKCFVEDMNNTKK